MAKTSANELRILFFIDNLRAGGKERRFVELLKGLGSSPDINFEVVVMNENIHYEEIFNLEIKIHYLIRKTKKDLSVFRRFYTLCKEYKPNIVHCWGSMPAVYAIPASIILRKKLINGMVVDTPVIRNITNKYWLRGRVTFPFSSLIIGNSNAGLKAYNAPPKKSICIYNGIDFKRFENIACPSEIKTKLFGKNSEDLFIIGMVAAFENRKDYKTLVKSAFDLLPRNHNLRFVLIGDGANFSEIKSIVPNQFREKIIFLGRRSDVEELESIFDIGVLLTDTSVHGEGISNSVIEYMALGKPVIATMGGGTIEAVTNNSTGFLINPFDVKQLSEKIEELMNDKEKRFSMGRTGLQFAKEKFDIKVITEQYIKTYQSLLNKKDK